MRRRVTVVVCLLAVAFLSLQTLKWFLQPAHRPLKVDGFALIRVGMLQAEEKNCLAAPPETMVGMPDAPA
jgi:hypothetical protein